jgi:probable rRNA maturation factor
MPKHKISIVVECADFHTLLQKVIQTAALKAFSSLDLDTPHEISILVSDDKKMSELNYRYRGLDKTTDVLSFENIISLPDSSAIYQGDIAISYPMALRQSKVMGSPIESELSLLTIHGVLHLFGYDHAEETEKKEMWAIQSRILSSLGFDPHTGSIDV